MRRYEEYNRQWAEGPKTSPSSPYRNTGSGSRENVSGTTKISGLLGSGSSNTTDAGRSVVTSLVTRSSSGGSGNSVNGSTKISGLLGSGTTERGRSATTYAILGKDGSTILESDDGRNWR